MEVKTSIDGTAVELNSTKTYCFRIINDYLIINR